MGHADRRGAHASESPIPVPFDESGAPAGAPLAGELGGMGILFSRTWAKPLSHFTSDNAKFLMLLHYFSFVISPTTDFSLRIPLCKMSEG